MGFPRSVIYSWSPWIWIRQFLASAAEIGILIFKADVPIKSEKKISAV
jgi:hypothetical protein